MEHNFTWKNDGRTKVMIGCGTRPEIIRLAAVIKRCREYFDCCVVYYNQNWDRNLSTVFWEDFELKNTFGEYGPDILVPVVGENLGVTCGNILGRSYELLSELQPEGYLVLGDTNSCLSAISAKRLHIPLFHMEAGNRCKDECLPEETNRRIVDVISDVNMCYSEFARKYLADTGLPKERTYQTGSPMAEVLHMNLEKIQKSDVLERLGLEKDKYILLSAHREENIDSEKNFLSLFTAINALAEKYDMPILYSCHPRSRNRLAASGFQLDPRVHVQQPLGFHDYNCLQMNAFAVVSDSGTLPEESSFFTSVGHPFPAVCRVQISAQGGLVLIPFAHSAVFQMGLAALHGVLVDGDTDDGGVIGHIIHDRQQDAFHHAAQTAGTGLALNGLAGDRVEGLVGELQLYTVHAQQFLVLLDQAVAGLLEHAHQCILVQIVQHGDDRQTAN